MKQKRKDNLKFKFWQVQKIRLRWWLFHWYDSFQQKFLLLSWNTYYTKSFQIYSRRTTNKNNSNQWQSNALSKNVFDTASEFILWKSKPRGFSSTKTVIRGRKFPIAQVHFLPIILPHNMYPYDHSSEKKKSGLSWNENRPQEGRGGMSTSWKDETLSEVLTDNGSITHAKSYQPFWHEWVKVLYRQQYQRNKMKRAGNRRNNYELPSFFCWKINLDQVPGIHVNFPYMHQRPTETFNTIYNILKVTCLHSDLQRGAEVITELRNANQNEFSLMY